MISPENTVNTYFALSSRANVICLGLSYMKREQKRQWGAEDHRNSPFGSTGEHLGIVIKVYID